MTASLSPASNATDDHEEIHGTTINAKISKSEGARPTVEREHDLGTYLSRTASSGLPAQFRQAGALPAYALLSFVHRRRHESVDSFGCCSYKCSSNQDSEKELYRIYPYCMHVVWVCQDLAFVFFTGSLCICTAALSVYTSLGHVRKIAWICE